MKSILEKIAGIVVAVTIVLGMFGCSHGSDDDPILTETSALTEATSVQNNVAGQQAAVNTTPDKETVATPTFSVAAGEVESGTNVTITCSTEGAKIYYTTDGSAPTAAGTQYTAAISITAAVIIKAVAVKDGMNDSAVASVSYIVFPAGFAKVTGADVGSFYIAKTELTYTKWYEVYQWAVNNGYMFQHLGREGRSGTDGAAPSANSKQPVIYVNWRDAVVWCNAASEKVGLTPVYEFEGSVLKDAGGGFEGKAEKATVRVDVNGYRLPTEAEWEYAAKGGANYTYSGSDNIDEVAWYSGNSESKTHDVGTKKDNGYGLFDMSGNVFEWCQDTYSSASSDRVMRGGCCGSSADVCSVSYRLNLSPHYPGDGTGFRVCRTAN